MKEHSKSRDAPVNDEKEEDVETGGGIECPDLHFSPPDGRSTREKAVIRVSCLVIREKPLQGRVVRAKRLAPRPDGPLTHFASPRGEKCRLKIPIASHEGT